MKQLRPYQTKAIDECWDALKKDDSPVLMMASVGAGKSLMLSRILLDMQRAGKRALCLVFNAELVRGNAKAFIEEGGEASIYCAALESKDISKSVIFGSPISVLNGIESHAEISKVNFNLIIVDEAHTINCNNDADIFISILRHYKQRYSGMRVLGATGTDFRFNGIPIVGNDCFFKTQVANIKTAWLIENGYLVKPNFEIDPKLALDFSKVKLNVDGRFSERKLQKVINENPRLTKLICAQIVHIMESQNRFGCFIFASTAKHAKEIFSYLPEGQAVLILGDTSQNERTKYFEGARNGTIRYIVNINVVCVGVDIPPFDTAGYLRLTESMVFMVQSIGRVLRLSDRTNKRDALVLDFAGNIERHSDWDDPILLNALKQTRDKDKPLVIECPACAQMNTEHARRCVGMKEDKRCDYFFEFKSCLDQDCGAKNDIAARHCWKCKEEIIDPNAKLSLSRVATPTKEVSVLEAKYSIIGPERGFRVNCAYQCIDALGNKGLVNEYYVPFSDKAMRMFYGNFVKKHCQEASKWYMHLNKRSQVEAMLHTIDTPHTLLIARHASGIKIKKKFFNERS